MIALIDLNRYTHDFTSAMWVCGSILLYVILREYEAADVSDATQTALGRLMATIRLLTVPSEQFIRSAVSPTLRSSQ